MKSYTDIEQSRKLSEFLPFKSADQSYIKVAIAGDNFNIPEGMRYRHNGNIPFIFYSGVGVPCWSIAALLNILPDGTNVIKDKSDTENEKYMCTVGVTDGIISTFGNNPVDACYEMILKLHELDLV